MHPKDRPSLPELGLDARHTCWAWWDKTLSACSVDGELAIVNYWCHSKLQGSQTVVALGVHIPDPFIETCITPQLFALGPGVFPALLDSNLLASTNKDAFNFDVFLGGHKRLMTAVLFIVLAYDLPILNVEGLVIQQMVCMLQSVQYEVMRQTLTVIVRVVHFARICASVKTNQHGVIVVQYIRELDKKFSSLFP